MVSYRKIALSILSAGSFILTVFVLSCSTVLFDTPQPVNSKDLSEVPEKLRGTWKKQVSDYTEIIKIDRDSYHRTMSEGRRIARSDIPGPGITRLDSGRIYTLTDGIETGYPYRLINDTVFYNLVTDESVILSDTALLRKAKGCYVLNLKKNDWWDIVLLKKLRDGSIVICYPVAEELIEMSSRKDIVEIDSTHKDSVIFRARFRTSNIHRLIEKDRGNSLYILYPDSTFETTYQ